MTAANRVIVLCTGRSASMAFVAACKHATNFTAAHESRGAWLGPARMEFPDRHIEVDNRLSWFLGRLERAIGPDAHYVHLQRDAESVAQSFVSRRHFGIMKAYREGILMGIEERMPPVTDLQIAQDMVDTVTENIRLFLRDKPNVMIFDIDRAVQDFSRFWSWIGAEGDLAAASAEWALRHNATRRANKSNNLVGKVYAWGRKRMIRW